MPEYLSPGVYVEEVSFRSKSIEGVPTSTTGFAGMTRWGPVACTYTDAAGNPQRGPSTDEPRLVTSFTEFESVYGGLEGFAGGRLNHVAHAARVFFLNGGRRLYIARVIASQVPAAGVTAPACSSRDVTVGADRVIWRGRWPGEAGNVVVQTQIIRSGNVAYTSTAFGRQATRVGTGSVVEIYAAGDTLPAGSSDAPVDPNRTHVVAIVDPDTGEQAFMRAGARTAVNADDQIVLLRMRVVVEFGDRRDVHDDLAAHPDELRHIGTILAKDHPEDDNAVVWLDTSGLVAGPEVPAALMTALQADGRGVLSGGEDGDVPSPSELEGREADPDDATRTATGLAALGEVDDIAIVALPDAGAYGDADLRRSATDALIGHAERMRYRIAVVDGPPGASVNEIRAFRGQFDSKYAALYHPWVEILDPTRRATQGAPPPRIVLPPCGFVAGIYARNDTERGVFKAPANEVVRGLTRFEANINRGRQDVLNPEGINALRFLERRGNRVWGARTMSSDPEWKYVNVRRLFIYLEHSIDNSTQWAVFEPNNERLWANIRTTIEDFLLVQWRDGALMGTKPEQAYFVRCDRTTMTQNDLDNGRLICLIGVAPTYPAEFVIFRIGQWTGDARQ